MKKRPLRYIWTILIFIILGAILNVAICYSQYKLYNWQIKRSYAAPPRGAFTAAGLHTYGFPSGGITVMTEAWGIPPQPINISHKYVLRWKSIVYDTIFDTAILWILKRGPFILRHWRRARRDDRIRRGRCGQCGYLVAPNIGVPGASPNCPECGTPIPPGTPTPTPGSPIPGTRITNPEIVRHDA